jgi:ATP-dependent Clp protease adaptor protein ClpS
MPEIAEPVARPGADEAEQTATGRQPEPGYRVVCWNDPVNLMVYVTHVFMVVFGWSKPKAELHMLEVHNQGRSILVRASLERAEHYVHVLQTYGLHATLERDAP